MLGRTVVGHEAEDLVVPQVPLQGVEGEDGEVVSARGVILFFFSGKKKNILRLKKKKSLGKVR